MRQWLVRPDLMCQQHLSGEHLETHMFRGSMEGNISLQGYYDGGLFFGPSFLLHRHTELAALIKGHASPMTPEKIAAATAPWPGMYSRKTYPDVIITTEAVKKSRITLLERCHLCRGLHLKEKREGRTHRYDIPARFSGRAVRMGSGTTDSDNTAGGNT